MFGPIDWGEIFGLFSVVFVLPVFLLFLAAGLLTWLWNMTMPQLFGIRLITYWQAFRLILISSILLGAPLLMCSL